MRLGVSRPGNEARVYQGLGMRLGCIKAWE